MIGGKFEMRDLPGYPTQAEIRQQAEQIAREMFPEKFQERMMLSGEEFDRRVAAAGWLGAGVEQELAAIERPVQVSEAEGESPISRLFSAVRAVLAESNSVTLGGLRAAYEALGLDDG